MQWSHLSTPFKPNFTGLLHTALVIIVIGACVTHFFGIQGEVHLRLGETTPLSTKHSTLSIFLWDFHVENDPATGAPADFVTELRILDRGNGQKKTDAPVTLSVDSGIVRMNKPLVYHNYRFCQSDYDSDEQGIVLNYNYDPWGIGITYTGYAMLLVAMIGFFFQRHTRFRSLLKKQHWILMLVLGVVIIALAILMTHVVTPKPPLEPVLQTPLLGIHVSVIMLAYTLFAIIMVNGILGLSMPSRREQLMNLSQVLLYPAEFCLTAGIFIGAVWANLSWGRYWGWDPKETWALITMLVYALLLHFPWIKTGKATDAEPAKRMEKRMIAYHIMSIVAFAFVLFTYFGVSYLLGGLHSYN